jgi:hypothetical protein
VRLIEDGSQTGRVMSMRVAITVALAASAGAALAIVGMMFAPSRSSMMNVLYPPTTTPTPTQTATPTDTPMPTPTETPDPNPLKSSCAVFQLAGARLLDEYDETSHVDPDDFAAEYGLAWAIRMLAAAAEERSCGPQWTDLRRRFSFISDQVSKEFENAQALYLLQNDYGEHAMAASNSERCIFYIKADAVTLRLLDKMYQAAGPPGSPDHKLLEAIRADLARLYWQPMRQQLQCKKGTKKKQTPQRSKRK